MKRHTFDPISLLFGIAAMLVGIAAINSRLGNFINDRPDAAIPLAVLLLGVVAIAVATKRSLQDVDGTSNDQHDRAE